MKKPLLNSLEEYEAGVECKKFPPTKRVMFLPEDVNPIYLKIFNPLCYSDYNWRKNINIVAYCSDSNKNDVELRKILLLREIRVNS